MIGKLDLMRKGEALSAVPYEYKESGLEGIFLHNGFDKLEHDGQMYVSVADTEGLHRCIGHWLIAHRKSLAPSDIRFLRKVMYLTQSELGRWIGKDGQTVARWEKGEHPIPSTADRLIRAIYQSMVDPDGCNDFLNLLKTIEDMDELTPRRVELYLRDGRWRDESRVAVGGA